MTLSVPIEDKTYQILWLSSFSSTSRLGHFSGDYDEWKNCAGAYPTIYPVHRDAYQYIENLHHRNVLITLILLLQGISTTLVCPSISSSYVATMDRTGYDGLPLLLGMV